ncbi:MAG: hypothetical protein QHG99_08140 [Methanomicrobiales archaeon]|nr:hypothetical protein [Methanomicrobiales archaeon]
MILQVVMAAGGIISDSNVDRMNQPQGDSRRLFSISQDSRCSHTWHTCRHNEHSGQQDTFLILKRLLQILQKALMKVQSIWRVVTVINMRVVDGY